MLLYRSSSVLILLVVHENEYEILSDKGFYRERFQSRRKIAASKFFPKTALEIRQDRKTAPNFLVKIAKAKRISCHQSGIKLFAPHTIFGEG